VQRAAEAFDIRNASERLIEQYRNVLNQSASDA
jgi:hypothetical protein